MAVKFEPRVSQGLGISRSLTRLNQSPVFRFNANLFEIRGFKDALSPNDRTNLFRHITGSVSLEKGDVRSAFVPLETPVTIDGITISALRMKGVFPKAHEDGEVLRYSSGKGFCDRLCLPTEGTKIRVTLDKEAGQFSPYGTLSSSRLETEVLTAVELGDSTDPILGYSVFEDLHFNGGPVGAAIYGAQRPIDQRFYKVLSSTILLKGVLPDEYEAAAQSGILLRTMHKKLLAHRYPHLGNYVLNPDGRLKIVDLDTTVSLFAVPKEQRLAFLYLDVARAVEDYMKDFPYRDCYDGEEEITYLTPLNLLPWFFFGYFNGFPKSDFFEVIKDFMTGDRQKGELVGFFGRLPEFSSGYCMGEDKTIIEPITTMYSSPNNTEIDLRDFMHRNTFRLFYDALEKAAFSLG